MAMRAGEGAAIIFLVVSGFAASNVAPTKPDLEAMYTAAAEDVTNGHYRDALRKIDAIDERQPDLAAAHNLRGVALIRLQEYRSAETALRKARVLDPDFWEARFNLAEVPFLAGNWTEARKRFRQLAAQPNEHMDAATRDLIEFKILLTCLLEGKDKLAAPVMEKLQGSVESPALYYTKAAVALRRKDRAEAKSWMATAEKEYSAQLNKLFAESFYEVGWLPKPKGAIPVALEVSSPAERVAQAQADLARAERAFRQRDFDVAWQLLDKVDASAPQQAVTYNLRGEILLEEGKIDEAEAALRNALAADPQLLSARYNMARVPFARKDYATARKELESLQGAFSGAKEERRTQLIRYQIFLTLLLEGHEGAAQKAMDEFKMMDDSPALYYAQAAWAFQHGNPKQGRNWVANAGNLYAADLNRAFYAPFADLGWTKTQAPTSSASPAPVLVQNSPPKPEPAPEATATPEEAVAKVSPSPGETKKEVAKSEATPKPKVSPSPKKVGRPEKRAKKERESGASAKADKASRKRSSRKKSDDAEMTRSRTQRAAAAKPASTPPPAPTASPPPAPIAWPPPEEIGEKVKNFFLYPFKRPLLTPTPAPGGAAARPATRVSPTPSSRQRPNN